MSTGKQNAAPQVRRGDTNKAGNAGLFDGRKRNDPEDLTLKSENGSPYSSMPVTDIDKELAGYYSELYQINSKIWKDEEFLYEAKLFVAYPQRYQFDRWKFKGLDTKVAAATERIAANRQAAEEYTAEHITPIDEEFKARGGWTRFYLVASSGNGHVHRNRSCSTCNYKTQFVWLTDESGKSEPEIVERAGDGACTVCYPTAPVADKRNPRPNPFEDPERKAAREANAAVKVAKAAAKAEKAITMPDGSPVLDFEGRILENAQGAETESIRVLSTIAWYDSDSDKDGARLESAARTQIALAAKRGVDVTEIQQSWTKKIKAKGKYENHSYQQQRRFEAALEKVNQIVASWDQGEPAAE